MQTDLQTLMIITGAVCGGTIIANLVKRRRKTEIFDTVTESQSDPLLDETEDLTFENTMPRNPVVNTITETTKKVIIDESVADVFLMEGEIPPAVEEPAMEESATQDLSFVALSVTAPFDRPFSGDVLFDALKANHLYYGKDKVFHRHLNDNPMQQSLYSILSITNPGIFNIDMMFQQSFTGILLLMTLSNRMTPLVVFEKMLNNARQLAVSLGGELCDAQRRPLTAQMMSQLREKIQKTHRRTLTQAQSGASVF